MERAMEPSPEDGAGAPTKPRRLSLGRRLGYAVLAWGLFVVLIEGGSRLGFRLAGKSWAPAPPTPSPFEKSFYVRRVVKPGLRTASLVTNSLGFRGGEPPKNWRSLPKVVCIGDSITWGWELANPHCYPDVLERVIAQDSTLAPHVVLNAGIPGANSMDVIRYLVEKVLPLKPDVLVILVGWNDIGNSIHLPNRYVEAPPPSLFQRLREFLLAHSACYQAVHRFLDARKWRRDLAQVLQDRETAKDDINWQGFDDFRRRLRVCIEIARAHQIEPVLVTLPTFITGNLSAQEKLVMNSALICHPSFSYRGWHTVLKTMNTTIRAIGREMDVPVSDSRAINDCRVFRDAKHLKRMGCGLLAEQVFDTLREHELLRTTKTAEP